VAFIAHKFSTVVYSNTAVNRVIDTRELCHIISTHAAECDRPLAFAKRFKFHAMECFLELGNRLGTFPQDIANILHIIAKKGFQLAGCYKHVWTKPGEL